MTPALHTLSRLATEAATEPDPAKRRATLTEMGRVLQGVVNDEQEDSPEDALRRALLANNWPNTGCPAHKPRV